MASRKKNLKKRAVRARAASDTAAPGAAPVAASSAAAPTPGERHLAFFEREAALSRSAAVAAEPESFISDDADPEAWGVPGRTIIAEGDSWFDYDVLGPDLIDFLRSRHKCRVIRNFARHGDTLENMVYGTDVSGGFQRLTPQFEATLALLREQRPRAFLFSGGGNDIAGPEFASFLDHKETANQPLRTWYADRIFNEEFPAMYERMIDRVLEASPRTYIFAHGYGNAIPSGVPARFALFTFGPWLRPSLAAKGWTDLVLGRAVVTDLIGRFNDMLAALAARSPQFHYVDFRPVIRDDDWENELHLGADGYARCAAELYAAIERTVPDWPR